jgi:hypothetical protein
MEATRLRLLPWGTPDGKLAYTPDDSPNGMIARLANRVEAEQLATAEAVLAFSRDMLVSDRLAPDECLHVMRRLTECLRDTLRVAESRGGRLPAPIMDPVDDDSDDDGPDDAPEGADA